MPAIEISKKNFNKIIKNQNNDIIISKKNGGEMKNKLTDLNNHLFEQLERLNDEDLTDEQMGKEIERSKAITSIANSIINNAKVVLDTAKFLDESGYSLEPSKETINMIGLRYEE